MQQGQVVLQGLIVDDSAVIRLVASKVLALLKFSCAEVEDCVAALEYCEKNSPDLILLGAQGRGGTTVDFLRRLRRLPGGDHPKILLCLAENDELAIGRALRAGADDVLFKPFDAEDVAARLCDLGFAV